MAHLALVSSLQTVRYGRLSQEKGPALFAAVGAKPRLLGSPDMADSTAGPNPSGLCMCGCGKRTPLASRNRKDSGWVKGQPLRYYPKHNGPTRPFYIVDDNDCWVWQRATTMQGGYGVIKDPHKGKVVAHRWYYEQAHGPVPDGMDLDHLCRNRLCVNPDHLEPVTRKENVHRGRLTKVTDDQVAEIRARHRRGRGGNTASLAAEYGISRNHLCSISLGSERI